MEKTFAQRIQKYIVAEAIKEFGYAGLAASDDGSYALINTGAESSLTIEINVK